MGSSSWSGEVLADAWLLSSRYLELALLHRMGVESPIRDRLNPERHDGERRSAAVGERAINVA
jgi:hypothetical protein